MAKKQASMTMLTDAELEALVRFTGERMSPRLKFLEDTMRALTELQERRQREAELLVKPATDE